MTMSVENKFKQIRNFGKYKAMTDEEVRAEAERLVEKKDQHGGMDVAGSFKNKEEKKIAKHLLTRYVEEYTIDTISDKNTLKELIYYEVVQSRLQGRLSELDGDKVPIHLIEIMSLMY